MPIFSDPVEKVMIEIKEVQGAKSTHEVIGGDKSHVVRPGRQYHVSFKKLKTLHLTKNPSQVIFLNM